MKAPTVSIVVPVYNNEIRIIDSLRSACQQTLRNIEIICVDDGSTDRTADLIKEFASQDERIHLITQSNNGPFSARYTGMQEATGEYILFMDSDDALLPEAAEILLMEAEKYQADIIEFGVKLLADEKRQENDVAYRTAYAWLSDYFTYKYSIPKNIGNGELINLCFDKRYITWNIYNKFCKTDLVRRAWESYNGEYIGFAEDMLEVLMMLSVAHNYVRINRELYYYNVAVGISAPGIFADSKRIKFFGCEAIHLRLQKEWMNKLEKKPEHCEAGIVAFRKEVRNNVFNNLFCRCEPDRREEMLGWIRGCISKEEFEQEFLTFVFENYGPQVKELGDFRQEIVFDQKKIQEYQEREQGYQKREEEYQEREQEYREREQEYRNREQEYRNRECRYQEQQKEYQEQQKEYQQRELEYQEQELKHKEKEKKYQAHEEEFLKRDQEYREKETEYLKQEQEYQDQIEEYCALVQNYQIQEKEQAQILLNKEGHIQQLIEAERQYQQTIANLKGHIELLLVSDRELELVKKTKSYRFTHWLRRGVDKALPQHTRRRFFVKIIYRSFTHPIMMLKMMHPVRIKNYFVAMKSGGMEAVEYYYNRRERITLHEMNPTDNLEIEKPSEQAKSKAEYEKLELPVCKKPQVSIVIPVYNEFDYTYNCIKSIIKNSGDVTYEVIVANDCSTDLTTEIESIIKHVRVITTKKNVRFLLNCNNAAKHAKGQYILFLNNDTQVQENWLAPLVELIERDEKNGMVGSKLVYPDGRLQEAGGIVWKDASAWNYGHLKDPDDPEYNYVKEADYISGAAIMIRKTLWTQIGGFDERFVPAYYEDTDLAFEVRKAGYKVLYQPLSKVVHFEGVSNGTDTSTGLKHYQEVNFQKFYDKWKDELEANHEENAVNVFTAKDRSGKKQQMLVVDHYVPHHDKDAGGKCTYMYLKLFVKMGFKVTFIGDNFFKHEPYTTELNQMGIEVLYGNYYYNNWKEWLKENSHYFDYIYLQRPHIAIKYIDIVKKYSKAKIFYFAHDLHHVREMREYELTGDKTKLESAQKWKKQEYELFEKADIGHVVGSYEQDIMQKAFPDKPIRNIPLYIYEDLPQDINRDFSDRHDLLYVGGFGHPPNVDAVLWFAENVFPKVLERIPDIKWHVVGGKEPEKIKELNNEHIIIEGFMPDEDLHRLYHTCRLAVVPLRYGAGVKGKVVESAYFQIPLVTTSIGAEGIDATMGNMLVIDDADRMVEEICRVYNDYAALKEMSLAGRKLIQKYYTLEEAERVIRQDL